MKKLLLAVFCLSIISGPLLADGGRISLKEVKTAWAKKTEPQIKQFVENNKGRPITVIAIVFKADTNADGGGTIWLKNQSNDVFEAKTDAETALSVNKGYAYTVSGNFTWLLDTDPNRHPVIYSIVKFELDNQSTHIVIGIGDASFEGGHPEGTISKAKRTINGLGSMIKSLVQ